MSNLSDGFVVYLSGVQRGLRPDSALWVDEWSDAHMRIPRGNGAEHGKYSTSRTPYAREPQRCLSPQHPCKRVVAKVASQLFKTQVGLNWLCAAIHQAPANMLALLPTDKIAKRVSNRISKTIEDVTVLRERVAAPRSRDSRNTVDTKEFEAGTLYIATAGSAANLAEVPARYIYGDEVDRWDISVDGEGSPIELAENRASTFGRNAKFYYSSSPTEEDASLIDDLFKKSDQRHYYVPCPHCGHMHTLEWDNVYPRYDDLASDEEVSAAWMACPSCSGVYDETYKTAMLEGGEWRAHAKGDGETVGFTLSQLYAPAGWTSWLALLKKFIEAKRALERGETEGMQVFYNTRLAKTWASARERVRAEVVKAAAEDYPLGIVPTNALILTAAVDTQGARLECKVVGWGPGLERWVVAYHVVQGDPASVSTWTELDELLKSPVQHAGGRHMVIRAVGIDTGGGYTQEVYDFCRSRRRRWIQGGEQRVLALKGASKPNRPVIASRPSKVDLNFHGRYEPHGVELWMIGTDTAKEWISNRMLLTTAGPGAVHYSKELQDEYFAGLTSEYKKTVYVKGHKRVEWWHDKRNPNEPFDLMVYNLAMAHHLDLHRKPDEWWERERLRLVPPIRDLVDAMAPPAAATPVTEPPKSTPPAPQHPAVTPVRADLNIKSDWSRRL